MEHARDGGAGAMNTVAGRALTRRNDPTVGTGIDGADQFAITCAAPIALELPAAGVAGPQHRVGGHRHGRWAAGGAGRRADRGIRRCGDNTRNLIQAPSEHNADDDHQQ